METGEDVMSLELSSPDLTPPVDWAAAARVLVARYVADNTASLAALPRPRRVAFIVWCDPSGEPREVTMEFDTQRRVRGIR